jgi:hypothetical protein
MRELAAPRYEIIGAPLPLNIFARHCSRVDLSRPLGCDGAGESPIRRAEAQAARGRLRAACGSAHALAAAVLLLLCWAGTQHRDASSLARDLRA